MAVSPFISLAKPSRTIPKLRLPKGSRLVVLGNGMVGAKFCHYLVEAKLHLRFQVTVIGREARPAYDRIRLSSLVDHRDPKRLELFPASWYAEHGIDLHLETSAERIQSSQNLIHLSDGQELPYDVLVFATGSRPFVPPIEGADLPGVFVYRTIDDLEAIQTASKGKRSATIIGGGLLGLEAAQAAQRLGLEACIVERARFLMSQQLNDEAAQQLQRQVKAQEIALQLGEAPQKITPCDGRLRLEFQKQEAIDTDIIIISAGIVPEGQVARDSGFQVSAQTGLIVDQTLETSEAKVYAIGECAQFEGRTYGLAAPGFAMARYLVDRLKGKSMRPFPHPDLSTRLKMLGVSVTTIGDALDEGRRVVYQSPDTYRMLLIGVKGKLIGALGVGEWPEASQIQSLFLDGGHLRESQVLRFRRKGQLFAGASVTPVNQWPEQRIVCNCLGVRKKAIVTCIQAGQMQADAVARSTGASTVCGSCKPLLHQLCGDSSALTTRPIAGRRLLIASCIAFLLALLTIAAPPAQMAESVESWWYRVDALWRDKVIKQVTGYGLTAIFTTGLLLSARKRLKWLRLGQLAEWRFFHALFGLAALFALFLHTGFHFGNNLNFWLMLTFVTLNLLGAAAGIITAIESRGVSNASLVARRWRPYLTYAHIILFWPLPVLLTFHILSIYLY